jgi:hypothetical protein
MGDADNDKLANLRNHRRQRWTISYGFNLGGRLANSARAIQRPMARTVKNAKMDTRSARVKLSERREPYWTSISAGCAIGYRRGSKGGTWLARFRGDDGKQYYEALGAADDARDADGLSAYSFPQAQEAAREFFDRKARHLAGHMAPADCKLTVADALNAYFADREQRGSKGLAKDRAAAEARILPELGLVELARLTTKRIRDWQSALSIAPRLTRAPRAEKDRKVLAIDLEDAEAMRARKATANRTLTVLKAALNHAFAGGNVVSDDAWRKVKPYREVDSPIVGYLSTSESIRLVNSCDAAFRDLGSGP